MSDFKFLTSEESERSRSGESSEATDGAFHAVNSMLQNKHDTNYISSNEPLLKVLLKRVIHSQLCILGKSSSFSPLETLLPKKNNYTSIIRNILGYFFQNSGMVIEQNVMVGVIDFHQDGTNYMYWIVTELPYKYFNEELGTKKRCFLMETRYHIRPHGYWLITANDPEHEEITLSFHSSSNYTIKIILHFGCQTPSGLEDVLQNKFQILNFVALNQAQVYVQNLQPALDLGAHQIEYIQSYLRPIRQCIPSHLYLLGFAQLNHHQEVRLISSASPKSFQPSNLCFPHKFQGDQLTVTLENDLVFCILFEAEPTTSGYVFSFKAPEPEYLVMCFPMGWVDEEGSIIREGISKINGVTDEGVVRLETYLPYNPICQNEKGLGCSSQL